MSTNQHSALSLTQEIHLVATTDDTITYDNCVGNNSLIVQEALKMNIPLHLLQHLIRRRVQTHGQSYTNLRELLTDLFNPTEVDEEVPMETDQLEEALMMESPVVKEALRMGVPHHCIKQKLRAQILSTGVGYSDVNLLLADLNMRQKKTTNVSIKFFQ